MKRTNKKNSKPPTAGRWWTLVIIGVLCLIGGINVSAQETDVKEVQLVDDEGHYYVSMPKEGTNSVNVGNDVEFFYIYGDKSQEEYTPGCDGTLIITVPEGNLMKIGGSIVTDMDKARLEITDIGDGSNPKMLGSFQSTDEDSIRLIDTFSSSNKVAIRLHSFDANSDPENCRIYLYVDKLDKSTENPVNVYSGDNGTITADKQSAKYGETVTLTIKPNDGYYIRDLRLDPTGEDIEFTHWSTGESTATFKMPPSEAYVYAYFSKPYGLMAELPLSGKREATLPTADSRVNVTHDDSQTGARDGYLHLKAPEGEYKLQMYGYLELFEDESLTIYDGADTNAKILYEKEKGNAYKHYLPELQTTGKDLLIHFSREGKSASPGFIDLKVWAVELGKQHNITINGSENGTVTTETLMVRSGDVVTIKVNPAEGYLLSDISIVDSNDHYIDHSDYTWWDGTNQMAFEMPDEDVQISAKFAKEYREIYDVPLYKIYVFKAPENITIPDGLKTFRIYSGYLPKGNDDVDKKLVLTAPAGKSISFTGEIVLPGNDDYVYAYDGTTEESQKIIDFDGQNEASQIPLISVTTTGNSALIHSLTRADVRYLYMNLFCEVNDPMQGTGTNSDPYQIMSTTHWNEFAAKVSNGSQTGACAKLMNDILVVATETSGLVGSEVHPYTGTFDGNGNELFFQALIVTPTEKAIAPFSAIDGASIKDLGVTGTIQVTGDVPYVGGIVGQAVKKGGLIKGCTADQYFISQSNNVIGGLVGIANGPLTIEDCLAMNEFEEKADSTIINGIIGTANASTTISNCMVNSEYYFNDELFNIFSSDLKNITLTNSYYSYELAEHSVEPQGIEATFNDLTYGKTLEKLQNGRTDDSYWAKHLFDQYPHPFRGRNFDEGSNDWSDDYVYYDTEKGSWFVHLYERPTTGATQITNYAFDLKTGEYRIPRSFEGSSAEPSLYAFCVPFDVDLSKQKFKAFRLNGMNATGDSISFMQVSGKLEASKPYLIKVTEDVEEPTFNDVMIFSKEPTPVSVGDVTMTGVYSTLYADSLASLKAYELQNDKQWHPVQEGNDVSISPTRAYLTIGGKAAAKAYGITLVEGEAAGINGIKTIDNDGSVRYYDLSGRYIGSSLDGVRKGVYITNKGKKVTK